jgi:hypothetical protein
LKTRSTALAERLDAYSASSKTIASKKWTKWEQYAAAMGSALALTTGASAGIISGTLTGVSISVPEVNSGNNNHSANMNFQLGAGGPAFGIHLVNTHHSANFTSSFAGNVYRYSSFGRRATAQLNGPGVAVNSHGAIKFASGDLISVAGSFGTNPNLHRKSTASGGIFSNAGNFPTAGTGIAGVRFSNSSGQHPGWIRLQLGDSNSDGFVDHLSALAYGYETTGSSILAGATSSAVPEPGTMALSLLALGSGSILAWRRRKRELEQPKAAE